MLHFWTTMSLCNNTTSCIAANTVSCSLSVVFIIVALGVLLFFKMYCKFIYRLLLYAFVALITTSISWTAYLFTIIKIQGQQVEFETFTNSSISIIFQYIFLSSQLFSFLLLTSMSLYMHILAIHHHQFTSWGTDIIFLIVCLILSQLTAITFLVISHLPYTSPVLLPIQKKTCFILLSLVIAGFTALADTGANVL